MIALVNGVNRYVIDENGSPSVFRSLSCLPLLRLCAIRNRWQCWILESRQRLIGILHFRGIACRLCRVRLHVITITLSGTIGDLYPSGNEVGPRAPLFINKRYTILRVVRRYECLFL